MATYGYFWTICLILTKTSSKFLAQTSIKPSSVVLPGLLPFVLLFPVIPLLPVALIASSRVGETVMGPNFPHGVAPQVPVSSLILRLLSSAWRQIKDQPRSSCDWGCLERYTTERILHFTKRSLSRRQTIKLPLSLCAVAFTRLSPVELEAETVAIWLNPPRLLTVTCTRTTTSPFYSASCKQTTLVGGGCRRRDAFIGRWRLWVGLRSHGGVSSVFVIM